MQWNKMTAGQKASMTALRDELYAQGVETSKSALAKEFDAAMAYRDGEIDLAALCEAIGADMPAPAEVDQPAAEATEVEATAVDAPAEDDSDQGGVEIDPPAAEYVPAPSKGVTAWVSLYDQEAPDVDGVDLAQVAHTLPMAEVLTWAEQHGYGDDQPDLYALVSVDPDASVGPAMDTLEVQVSRIAAAEIRGAGVWGDAPLGRNDVARLLGVAPNTVSRYMVGRDTTPFPAPSGRFGRSPWWAGDRAGEILVWAARRPGRTGRPRKTTA